MDQIPIVDFLEADELLLERVGDEDQAALQAERPGIGDPLGQAVAGILRS